MNKGLVLALLLLSIIVLTSCVQQVALKSIPPVNEIDKTPREGCNNNGVVEGDEECDDGNWIKNDMCDRCKKTFCGDGTYNNNPNNAFAQEEQCDAQGNVELGRKQCGNTTGVNASCGINCRCYAEEIVSTCGDGVLDGFGAPPLIPWVGEECDAAGQAAADAQCLGSGLGVHCNLNTCTCGPCNNDGVVDAGELCDDGNVNPNDACDLCKPTRCGDFNINTPNAAGLNEQCEVGFFGGFFGCNPGEKCQNCQCVKGPQQGCGDGKADPGEQCGDPGTPGCASDETCANCKCQKKEIVEEGCIGDGKISAGEECDPGDYFKNILPTGCKAPMFCDSDCKCVNRVVTPRCGDGYISFPWPFRGGGGDEECDLGGKNGAPVKPNTCPFPKQCINCKCVEYSEETDPCLSGDAYNSLTGCQSHCEGQCVMSEDERCYNCQYNAQLLCPQGTTPTNCPENCDGCQQYEVLPDGTKCMQCVTYSCSGGTYKTQSQCQSSCSGTCSVAQQVGEFSCWRCNPDCETLCAQNNKASVAPDPYSIQDYLNANGRCAERALISVSHSPIQGCECYSEPSISFTGQLICQNTPCGPVPCDSSTQCSCGENCVTTVSCSWGGWNWLGSGYNYQSVAGVQG